MHDLVDAYSRAVAEATERAREKRGQAGRLFDDALDAIGADFQADVAAAGMALEVGMQARAAGFRGENIVVTNVDLPEKPSVITGPRFYVEDGDNGFEVRNRADPDDRSQAYVTREAAERDCRESNERDLRVRTVGG